jgi:hypothetical protein
MGLKFEFGAMTKLYEWYGGHPLLTRLACSWLNTILSISNQKPIDITQINFESIKNKIDNELEFLFSRLPSNEVPKKQPTLSKIELFT